MSKWQTPITDRDLNDILNRTAKAFLNVADWVRIHGNTDQVQVMIRLLLFLDVPASEAPALTSLEEPAITDFPAVEEINSLIENIDLLRQAASFPAISGLIALKYDWQAGAGAQAPNYERVNEWERDLLLIRDMLINLINYQVWCGVANVGQPRFWQHRFRDWPYYVPDATTPVRLARTGLATSGAGLDRNNGFRRYD